MYTRYQPVHGSGDPNHYDPALISFTKKTTNNCLYVSFMKHDPSCGRGLEILYPQQVKGRYPPQGWEAEWQHRNVSLGDPRGPSPNAFRYSRHWDSLRCAKKVFGKRWGSHLLSSRPSLFDKQLPWCPAICRFWGKLCLHGFNWHATPRQPRAGLLQLDHNCHRGPDSGSEQWPQHGHQPTRCQERHRWKGACWAHRPCMINSPH